ncbi:arylesterase [Pedobacter jejuensis]|uniref:Arylesterase n=1 Tax=Pedobacter jejuensis TaxID=1268550 RepID=A0A3N0BXR7_9SPHI|nr:arylesterase [Pedobacter jejuensis]RNL54280.1 arylesterase [Pedobacter jejuensis]
MLRKRLMVLIVLTGILQACSNTDTKNKTELTDSAKNTKGDTTQTIKNILFFGTSLTAGYGLDPTEAYPALIQNRIDSLKMAYKVINGGLSGETSAGGKGRIDWLLKQKVDVFVLELGSNDGLRGVPVAETTKNLQFIIDRVKSKYPDAKLVIAGMQMPPSMGKRYTTDFKDMFPQLAKKNNMSLIPFLLENVAGVAKLNQADGIHPTAEGDKILSNNVWVVLKPLL